MLINKKLEFSQRFYQVVAESCPELNNKELAEHLGFTAPSISDWMAGKKIPNMESSIQICEKLNCSVEWLLTGRDIRKLIRH
jgi:transcriptional regulator with XRE-family HTH domain